MEELNKKLLEFVGLEVMEQETRFEHQVLYREKPEDTWKHLGELRFTQSLDACFKWLVPEATKRGYIIETYTTDDDTAVTITKGGKTCAFVCQPEFAPALSLAFEKLIDGEKDV